MRHIHHEVVFNSLNSVLWEVKTSGIGLTVPYGDKGGLHYEADSMELQCTKVSK